jgi:hypothetical protein
MNREIKFRFWNGERMFEHYEGWSYNTGINEMFVHAVGYGQTIMQFTGLKDKNGKNIYEGDIVRWRKPYRTTQTHYGDNIPNGAYTEPMEPGIKVLEGTVEFRQGTFGIESEDGSNDIFCPLIWDIQEWDEVGIKEAIIGGRNDIWDDPEEGDLQYLLETYKLENVQALIDLLSGVEVIGNIYEPESES